MNHPFEELAKKNSHIPTHEIEQDIKDTEAEIHHISAQVEHHDATPISSRDARMNHMRASAGRSGISERQKFVDDLRGILDYRKHYGNK